MTEARLDIRVNSAEVDKGKNSLDALAQSGENAEKGVNKTTTAAAGLTNAARVASGALAAMGVSMGVREIVQYADEWQNASNRLRLVTADSQELAKVQQILLQTANDTRAGFSGTAELFTVLTRSTRDLGLSQTEIIDLTRTLNQSFAVSGASAGAMDGAIRQLSQGLQSGALRGDEFNSVAEQAPAILDAVAASLQMSRGELREFAAEGGITSEVLVRAIQDYAHVIEGDFSRAQMTFGQSMLVAKNNMLEFVGGAESVDRAVSLAGQGIVFATENLDEMAGAAEVLAVLVGSRLVASLGASTVAMTASVAQSIAATSATTALTAATTSLRGALALLGGPLGATTIALGLLAKAYLDVQKARETAFNRAQQQIEQQGLQAIDLTMSEVVRTIATYNRQLDNLRENAKWNSAAANQLIAVEAKVEEQQARLIDLMERRNRVYQASIAETETATETTAALATTTVTLSDGVATATIELLDMQSALDNLSRRSMPDTEWRMKGVTTATEAIAASTVVATQRTREFDFAQAQAAQAAQRQWEQTRDYLATTFIDIADNGGSAFQRVGDAFVAMVKRMVAEWAAVKALNFIGFGAPLGASGVGSAAVSGAASAIGGAAVSGAGSFIGGAVGKGVGVAAGTVGPPTAAAAAGAGFGSSVAAFATNPVTLAILGAGAAAALLDNGGTPTFNAGFMLQKPPSLDPNDPRLFDVAPFASGFDPVGFVRDRGYGDATGVIDVFRAYDAALTDIARKAGLNPQMGPTSFGGFSDEGQGSGLFFGVAGEDGGIKSQPIEKQLMRYISQYIDALGVDPALASLVKSQGSPDAMIATARQLAGVDGSHASGLSYVPFDGYRAELHRGERVQTSTQAMDADRTAAEVRALRQDMKNMLISMNSIVVSSNQTARALSEAVKQGEGALAVISV